MAHGPIEDKEKMEKDYNRLYHWYGNTGEIPSLTRLAVITVVIIGIIVAGATILENLN